MTLIATALDTETGQFIGFGDIMIWDSSYEPGNDDTFPSLAGRALPFETIGKATRSKAVLFERGILLWSGPVLAAKFLANLVSESEPSNANDFYEQCKEAERVFHTLHSVEDLLAAIYYHYDGEFIWDANYRCETILSGSYHSHVGGSGRHGFSDTFNKVIAEKLTTDIYSIFFSVIGELTLDEVYNPYRKWDFYGGGYEVYSNKEGGGFRGLSFCSSEVRTENERQELESVGGFGINRVLKSFPLNDGYGHILFLPEGDEFVPKLFLSESINRSGKPRTRIHVSEIFETEVCICSMQNEYMTLSKVSSNTVLDVDLSEHSHELTINHDVLNEMDNRLRALWKESAV